MKSVACCPSAVLRLSIANVYRAITRGVCPWLCLMSGAFVYLPIRMTLFIALSTPLHCFLALVYHAVEHSALFQLFLPVNIASSLHCFHSGLLPPVALVAPLTHFTLLSSISRLLCFSDSLLRCIEVFLCVFDPDEVPAGFYTCHTCTSGTHEAIHYRPTLRTYLQEVSQ